MKKYTAYKFTAKIEARTETGEWELLQDLSGAGMIVKKISDIKKWVGLLRENKD